MVRLLQRALVQVGSTSQAINIERRRIAWGRMNPGHQFSWMLSPESLDQRDGSFYCRRILLPCRRQGPCSSCLRWFQCMEETFWG